MESTQSSPTLDQYILHWSTIDGAVAREQLGQGDLIIGRSRDCHIVLTDEQVSRRHARLTVAGDSVTIRDLGSSNGLLVNGERTDAASLMPGARIRIGRTELLLALAEGSAEVHTSRPVAEATTVSLTAAAAPLGAVVVVRPAPAVGPVLDDVLAQPILSERVLLERGVEVKTAEYAALGAGQGSFAWVSYLRNSGCQPGDITVVGIDEQPYGRYQRLCENSQIPPHERLRSNSESCPDNIWGFPGYASREIWGDAKRLKLAPALSTAWQIFGEPTIAQTYTPRSGDVFRAMEREARRIGWYGMYRRGRIRAIRKSDQGRLLAIVSEGDGRGRRHFVVSGRFLHLAVGYPAIRLLDDLTQYRETSGDHSRVVSAYEAHTHVYDQLQRHGGTVLLRGRGIVASRVIQRLWEARQSNQNISIIHLHRSRLTAGHRDGRSRRVVEHQFEFQPFNWPKGAWTGEQRQRIEQASDTERKQLLDIWGGTTTANRRDWRRIITAGLREGWYRPEFGVVQDVRPATDGRVATRIASGLSGGGVLDLSADFVIDCTGAESGPDNSPLVADLMRMYNAPLNPLGRLKVSDDFEVETLRHGDARLYACGTSVLGGPHAAVDSFLGLQYAALRAVDAMYRLRPRPKHLRRLNGLYSLWQWTKWARGVTP